MRLLSRFGTGKSLVFHQGEILLDRLLKEGVDIAHDCGGVLACSSCRVVLHEGLEHFDAASDVELDLLDRGDIAVPGARLACQINGAGDLVVKIPRGQAPSHTVMLPVSVSERAARHFALQLAKHPDAVAVRMAVVSAGSGFRYRIAPACAVHDDDQVLESHGARIVVDAASLPYLQGTTIDLAEDGLARHVCFDNQNARQSCGCGESFGV